MCPKRDIKAKYEASMDKKKANKQTNKQHPGSCAHIPLVKRKQGVANVNMEGRCWLEEETRNIENGKWKIA